MYEKINGKEKCNENIKKILRNIDCINDTKTNKMRVNDIILLYLLKTKKVSIIKIFEKLKINIKNKGV